MLEELKELINEYSEKEINLNTELKKDLGLTSFDFVSLISDIEDKYNIKIEEEYFTSISTIEDLIKYIENNK